MDQELDELVEAPNIVEVIKKEKNVFLVNVRGMQQSKLVGKGGTERHKLYWTRKTKEEKTEGR